MTQQMIAAQVQQQKLRPAFYVTKLEGEREVTFYKSVPVGKKVDKDGNPKNFRLEPYTEMRPMGWLITIPKPRPEHNHSFHIETKEEMIRLGFHKTVIPLYGIEDDTPVGVVPNVVRREGAKEEDGVL